MEDADPGKKNGFLMLTISIENKRPTDMTQHSNDLKRIMHVAKAQVISQKWCHKGYMSQEEGMQHCSRVIFSKHHMTTPSVMKER